MERVMEKKYSTLHKRIGSLKDKLNPIISESLTTETPPPYSVSEEIDKNFQFINNLIHAEFNSKSNPNSDEHDTHHLNHVADQVRKLQNVFRKWAKVEPTSSSMESNQQPFCRLTYPCLDEDADHEEGDEVHHEDDEKFSTSRFTVYENPEFVDYYDQDQDGVVESEEEEIITDDNEMEERENAEECIVDDQDQEKEIAGIQKEENIISGYHQKSKQEEKKSSSRYGFRVVFWVLGIGIGICCMKAGFSCFQDYHSPDEYLTPT